MSYTHPCWIFDSSLLSFLFMWEDFLSFFVSPEWTESIPSLLFPQWLSILGTQVKEWLCTGHARTQACWTTCTSPSGLVTAKICMTSHSAEDKAHWFLPDRAVGGGCQSNARTGEREKCRLADGFAAAMCVYVCVCAEILYLHTCETAGGFPNARALYGWCRVWLHTRVPNVYMSMPSCPACQDNGRQCIAAKHNNTVITDSTLTLHRFYTHCNKGLVPTSVLPSLNDAMQLPSAIQGNNTPTALSAILSPVSFTVIIITPPAELQS